MNMPLSLQTSPVVRFPRLRRQLLAACLVAGALIGPALAGGSSFKHEYLMRGQILEANAGNVVLCVGEKDGAQVGQVLDVIRHVRIPGPDKKAASRYRRENAGEVKIVSLFDEHYANAKVIKGAPEVHDTVELNP